MKDQYTLRFFLGANSPLGFVSRFDQLADPEKSRHTYILKGGPGTGKSTLLRKIAGAFGADHPGVEEIHCSSDFSSLDAVILGDTGVSIVDGTLPHAIDLFFLSKIEKIGKAGLCPALPPAGGLLHSEVEAHRLPSDTLGIALTGAPSKAGLCPALSPTGGLLQSEVEARRLPSDTFPPGALCGWAVEVRSGLRPPSDTYPYKTAIGLPFTEDALSMGRRDGTKYGIMKLIMRTNGD